MKFEVNILGCAAATPTLNRNPTAQLINVHDKLVLIDCSEGTQLQLRRFKFRFQKIGHIFISHLHGDHYLGLFGLISSMHLLGRTKDLHIYGPPGLHDLIDRHIKASQTFLNYTYIFHAIDSDRVAPLYEDNTFTIHSFPLKHRIPTTGFIIKEKPKKNRIIKEMIREYGLGIEEILNLKKGMDLKRENGDIILSSQCTKPPLPPRKYVYMSDTAPLAELPEEVLGMDLLYHESTFLEENKERAKKTYHSTAKQAANIALKAKASKLCLGHYSNRYTDISLFEKEAREVFPEVVLARDGLSIRIE
ncbi:MAG: ribonuclease Z [Flavobacteriales bacterium]